jgi:TolB-like protein/Tfp pilus assembly protein PilF
MTDGFMAELKRRNVLRMAGLYLVTAWLVVQVGATLLPVFDAPAWTMKALVVTLAVAFLPSVALAWVFELTPQGLKRDADVPASQTIAPHTARKLDRAIIVVLLLALGYFAFDKFALSPRRDAALVAETSRVARSTTAKDWAARGNSIAVLPLANASGDENQRFFSDGLSENLIDALSKFEGLRVIGRTSSFRFRDSKEDAHAIGAKLGVAFLLAGSVQRSADVVRIRAEVVRTDDGSALWTKQYDRPYGDLFALQDELTQSIARVLKTRLVPGDGQGQTDRPPSGNLEAYGAYLQGRFNADLGSEQDMRRAIDDMQRATRLDPGYAMAWAALSRNWTTLAALGLSGDGARHAYAEARRAGDIAIALAPGLGDAHVARGWWLENSELDWRGATAEYRRALELAPDVLQTKFSVASMLALQGQLQEAIKLSGEAIEDEPMSPNWWNWYSAYLSAVGRLDDAEAAIRKSIELRPQGSSAWAQLAVIEIQRGDAAAAMKAAEQEPVGVWHEIARAMALQVGRDRRTADAALEKLIADHGDVAAYQIAQVQALRNDADATFQWLQRARETRDPGVGNTLIDPLVMRYKTDPRLAAFCKSVGLPPPTESQTKGI